MKGKRKINGDSDLGEIAIVAQHEVVWLERFCSRECELAYYLLPLPPNLRPPLIRRLHSRGSASSRQGGQLERL